MEFELTSAKRSSDEQHCTIELGMDSNSSERQSASDDNQSPENSDKASESGEISDTRNKWNKILVLAFALFTILAMIVGVLTVCFTSPKPSETCQRTFKRTMKSSLVSSSQPRCVAIGDVNNDHQMDIVVANFGTNTIGVFLSKGDGIFEEQQTYSTGSESLPYWIAVSDFNGDNYLDIAVANYGINNIGIFLGNGSGAFADQKMFSLGSSRPSYITVDDFNQDNAMDIVVANYGTNSISILLGYGNGSFEDPSTYSTDYDSVPSSLAVGDFNHDNHLDIAVANYGTNNIGVFFGYGNGIFTNQTTYTTTPNSNPSSIAVGDFNNDNQLDIAVTNNGIGSLGIFLGKGNGTFLAQTTYSTGFNSYPQYITVSDFNKDNALDIAIVDSKNDRVYVFLGYGNGSFATITTYYATSGSNPYWIVVTDFNNNNQSDIVIANYGANNVLVLIDYSYKPSAIPTNYNVGPYTKAKSVAVTDLNNDNIFDIIFGIGTMIFTLIGLGNGTFATKPKYSTDIGSSSQYIYVGDLNSDNRMDFVSANKDSDCIGVFLGHGDGTFANMTTYSSGIGSNPWWVTLGDVNNDNRLDIISANTGINTIGIYLGNGDGTFSIMVNGSINTDSAPYAVVVDDINNDNYLDIAVITDNNYLIIYLASGDTIFIFSNEYYTGSGSSPNSVAFADFNSDTYLDIVVANTYTNNVGVFLGYGNGTFAEQTTYSTGSDSQPYYAIAADFNNDNIYDIAVTNFNTDEIVIFYGDGNGSFELARIYSTGSGSKPYGITAADLANNKHLEIVVGLWGTGDLAVLTEYYAAEFANQTAYSTGSVSQPYSVAFGDFNNDNRSDIVVANSGTNNLGILLSSINDTFDIEMMYLIDTDVDPQYVITCDIDNDNRKDIVSANSKSDSISVIMGYGNGTFAEQMIYATGDGSQPYAVASGDFNKDTRLDLVIANEGTDSIGIFLGYNYTSFQSQVTFSSNDSLQPYGVAVSDFNNDNYLDVAATFSLADNIGILLGCGNGSFSTMIMYSTGNGSTPNGIAVGDFNNDGRSDIVVTNFGTNNVGILLGYGNGSFAAIITYSTGDASTPINVSVGDINNDDELDIAVANYGTNNVGVLLGYGNGSFSVIQTYSTGEGSYLMAVAVIDIDIDGKLDILAANSGNDNVGIFFGYGNGSFENQVTYSTGYNSQPYDVTVGDFNSDNRLDIAVPLANENVVGILLGNGNRTFAGIMTYSTGTGSTPCCVRVDDFNNDNYLDIAVVNIGTNNIVVLFGFEDRMFLLGKAYSTGIESQPNGLAIGDFNKDGRLDIAVANNAANNIGVFLGYSSEPFAGIIPYATGDGSQPHTVVIGDLDNDGWSDIVVANYGTDNVGVLLGHRNAIFDPIITYPTGNGSAPYSVAVVDFNDDTYLDIVVTNSETDSITILFGYGNGSFEIGVTYSTGARSRPYTVAIGDFNNDNISDISVANSGTSNIFLLYGYGNGTFGNETSYSLGYGYLPYSIAVQDLNQDNWMDIAIACYGTDHVETLIQMC